MTPIILDEALLDRLSPAARREVLSLVGSEVESLRSRYAELAWNPEGTESYPLSAEETRLLLHGMPDTACAALRVFAENFDGSEGSATFQQLLDATGHSKLENVNRQLTWILLHLRAVTGNPDAWLVGWRAKDWIWDDTAQTWSEGKYYVTAGAVETLREALAVA